MYYYKLKMKSLPRITFAVTHKESEDYSEEVTTNDYTMMRFVEEGRVDVKIKGFDSVTIRRGEYYITPKDEPYSITTYKGTVETMFSFYLDYGVEKIVERDDIRFDHPDNYVYVDIESLFIPQKGHIDMLDEIYGKLKRIISIWDRPGEYANIRSSSLLVDFFVSLAVADLDETARPGDQIAKSERYCLAIEEYVSKNYDKPITMTTFADLLTLHENYISRVYKSIRGYTVMDYIFRYRIGKAKELLMMNKYSVADVARKVGFNSVRYFIMRFKKVEQVTPGKYYKSLFEQRLYSFDKPDYIDPEDAD